MDSLQELKNKLNAYAALPSAKINKIASYLLHTAEKVGDDVRDLKNAHKEEMSNAVMNWVDKLARDGKTLEIEMNGYSYSVAATKIHTSLKK